MSTLKIDELKNNGSAIDLPNGIKVGGNEIVQGYTSSGTEPASPATGDFWWDSTNELLYQYLNGEFKAIGITVPALDVSAFTYDNVSYQTATSLSHCGIAFRTDGTSLYAVGSIDDTIYQYSMTTAWDLSTAAYASKLKSVNSQEGSPRGLAFKTDGTSMYVVGRDNNRVYQYSLSTAWDVSTASYANKSFLVSSYEYNSNSLTFKPDGSVMYVIGYGNDTVFQFNLSTAWDVSTASYTTGDNFSAATQDTVGMAVSFSTDGLKMLVSGSSSDSVHQYSLSTAWTVNTASYDNLSFSMLSQTSNVNEGFLSPDQDKFYTIDGGTSYVYQYSTNF